MRVRKELGFPSEHTNAYRLVHGEGDGMPGLIIDVYADVAVVQPHSAGMQRALPSIAAALEHLGIPNVVHKPANKEKPDVMLGSVSERTLIQENGTLFQVDIIAGQKTGFFLDQRDNRALVRHYAKSKSVLNVFSYTGGFSMAAVAGGAASAISLDSAASALSLADANAQLNNIADRHRTLRMDAVPYLEGMGEKFDLIVLDPPAFAKHMSARSNAIQAYRRINAAALNALKPGGILFTFSCSQVVDRQQFYDTVASAAIQVKRSVRVLHHLRQPSDHPVSIFHPEGEYLKGLALMVE
jgi:23S rRNA (cytosine1962-C5)-methyltransferase